MSKFLPKALSILDRIVEGLVIVIIGLMVVNIAGGVFFRYVLRSALYWTEELGRYLMIWGGMLGAYLAMKEDSHVGIVAVVNACPPPVRKVLVLVAHLVVSTFLALIVVYSVVHLDSLKIQRSSAMEIPMAIPYFSVTLGAALMSIQNIVNITLLLRNGSAVSSEANGEGA